MLCQFLPYPSRLSQSTRLSSLCYTTAFHQPSILHTVIYVSKLFSQLVPPSPSLAVSTSSFPTSTSLFTPCKQVPQYHFSRFHMLTQLCPTLCDPMDCSPPDSSIHGILQARILDWVAIPFLQGIFPIQGSKPSLLHCRQILYSLSLQGRGHGKLQLIAK